MYFGPNDRYPYSGGPRLLSRPVELHFAGWTSDTYRLQQAGWSIAVNEEPMYGFMSLALKHPQLNLFGSSDKFNLDYYKHASYPMDPIGPINVRLASNFVMQSYSYKNDKDWSKYQAIDAAPQWIDSPIQSLNDMKIFAPNLVRTKEIIIPEYDVDDLLNMIIEKQQPAREQRIIQAVREDEMNRPKQTFHAQIISLAA